MLRSLSIGSLMTLCMAVGAPGQLFAATSCESLRSLTIPGTTITAADMVSSGPSATLPPHCRVAATLKPSPDSDIKIVR